MEKNKNIGKKFYYMNLGVYFGNINFSYWEFKIKKVYKITALVESISELGCSYNNKVKLENLEKNYFKTIEECIDCWKERISKTVDLYKNDLKKYTKQHEEYDTFLKRNKILDVYNEMIKDFSEETFKIAKEKIHKILTRDANLKVEDRVEYKTPNGEIRRGNIVRVNGNLFESIHNSVKISYQVKMGNGDFFGSLPEKVLNKIK